MNRRTFMLFLAQAGSALAMQTELKNPQQHALNGEWQTGIGAHRFSVDVSGERVLVRHPDGSVQRGRTLSATSMRIQAPDGAYHCRLVGDTLVAKGPQGSWKSQRVPSELAMQLLGAE